MVSSYIILKINSGDSKRGGPRIDGSPAKIPRDGRFLQILFRREVGSRADHIHWRQSRSFELSRRTVSVFNFNATSLTRLGPTEDGSRPISTTWVTVVLSTLKACAFAACRESTATTTSISDGVSALSFDGGLTVIAGHFEKAPFNQSTMRSAYHMREIDTMKVRLLRQPIDICISHDWPRNITDHGNVGQLLRVKSFFEREVINTRD